MTSRKTIALWTEEPFRVFFPLGLVLGMCGAALWPMFVWHAITYYPSNAHVRLMIEGLMGSFIIGFLGTAGPRLLDAEPFRAPETFALFGLQVLSASLHLARQQSAGDIVFLILLLLFLGVMGTRVRKRARGSLPPPSFVLVLIGYFSAIAGVAFMLTAGTMSNGVLLNQLGALMLNQGLVLLPILGVGAFFFSKLLGGARPELADLEMAKEQWKRKAGIAAAAAILILASFALETADWIRTAAALRGVTTLLYFSTQGRLFERPAGPPFLAHCFRIGFLLLVAGLLLPVVLPAYRVANLHVTFLGGFSVILFTVSTRVIIGHSGQSHLFQKRMPFLVVALSLLILAMTARVAADFSASVRNSHLVYAALIWLGAAAAWAWALFPKLLSTDESDG
jgi:uncharacterized protein involved in response to NO